jgi:hypothetical protein
MKSLTIIAIISVVILGVAFVAYYMQTGKPIIPPPDFRTPLLVIADDAFVDDTMLTNYLSTKASSYKVTLTRLSTIPYKPETRQFFKVRVGDIQNVEYTCSTTADTLYLATDIAADADWMYYTAITATYVGGWHVVNNFGNAELELCPILDDQYNRNNGWQLRTCTITYNGGQTITMTLPNSVPSCYTWWGHARFLLNGELAFKRTRADDIYDYIQASGARYVLLVGSYSIPGFHVVNPIDVLDGTGFHFWDSMTDHPFMCKDIYGSNMMMSPSVPVSRLPARSIEDLHGILNKLMSWFPHQTSRIFMWQYYEYTIGWNSVCSTIESVYGSTCTITKLTYPTSTQVVNQFNVENDLVVAFAHGGSWILEPLYPTSIIDNNLKSTHSNIVWAIACATMDFTDPAWKSPSERFLTAETGTCGYFGSATIPEPEGLVQLFNTFFSSTNGLLGDRYVQAETQFIPVIASFTLFNRLCLNFFGDVTLSW